MNNTCIIAMVFDLLVFSAVGFAQSAANGSAADTMAMRIFRAVEQNDLDRFVADGDNQFKAAITKQMFEGVHAMVAPRMKKGYEVIPLGILNQQGCQVYLRKLVFKDGGDDILARLAVRDRKVAGFWFQ